MSSLGINIGYKNKMALVDSFSRPVLIIKRFNKKNKKKTIRYGTTDIQGNKAKN